MGVDRYGPTPRPEDDLRRFWKVTSTAIAIATVGICLFLLWNQMSRGSFDSVIMALLALMFLGLLWLLAGATGLWLYRAWRLNLIAPLVVALTFAVASAEVPDKLGWALSKDALERVAITCAPTNGTRLGLYSVRKITKRDGGCLIYDADYSIGLEGFAYFPDNALPPNPSGIHYKPFAGPWYRFYEGS